MLADGTAVIEMAAASGLELIAPARRDPMRASSHGVGELILAALDAGARHIILGLGGSATNDAGAGMLTALGARLLDAEGHSLPPGGARWRGSPPSISMDSTPGWPARASTWPATWTIRSAVRRARRTYSVRRKARRPHRCMSWTRRWNVLPTSARAAWGRPSRCARRGRRGRPGLRGQGIPGRALSPRRGHRGRAGRTGASRGRRHAGVHRRRPDGCADAARQDAGRRRPDRPAGRRARGGPGRLAGRRLRGLHACGISAAFSLAPGPITLQQALNDAERLLHDRARDVMQLWMAAQKRML